MSRRSKARAERQIQIVRVGTNETRIAVYAPVRKQPRKGPIAVVADEGEPFKQIQLSCRPRRRQHRLNELKAQYDFVEVRNA